MYSSVKDMAKVDIREGAFSHRGIFYHINHIDTHISGTCSTDGISESQTRQRLCFV